MIPVMGYRPAGTVTFIFTISGVCSPWLRGIISGRFCLMSRTCPPTQLIFFGHRCLEGVVGGQTTLQICCHHPLGFQSTKYHAYPGLLTLFSCVSEPKSHRNTLENDAHHHSIVVVGAPVPAPDSSHPPHLPDALLPRTVRGYPADTVQNSKRRPEVHQRF